jgi:hypothetical protein
MAVMPRGIPKCLLHVPPPAFSKTWTGKRPESVADRVGVHQRYASAMQAGIRTIRPLHRTGLSATLSGGRRLAQQFSAAPTVAVELHSFGHQLVNVRRLNLLWRSSGLFSVVAHIVPAPVVLRTAGGPKVRLWRSLSCRLQRAVAVRTAELEGSTRRCGNACCVPP